MNNVVKSLVLNHRQVTQKIRRMAYEIFENNFKEKHLILAGIQGQGEVMAQQLAVIISEISPIKTEIVSVKRATLENSFSVEIEPKLKHQKCNVVIVDDVLNTGRTLMYGMFPFIHLNVKQIEVAVLVNRSHPTYPIMPTYTGYRLATTLSDHVEVKLNKTKSAVYLK